MRRLEKIFRVILIVLCIFQIIALILIFAIINLEMQSEVARKVSNMVWLFGGTSAVGALFFACRYIKRDFCSFNRNWTRLSDEEIIEIWKIIGNMDSHSKSSAASHKKGRIMSIRLLIVEDENEIRDKYRELLDKHKFIDLVGEAINQEDAWIILCQEHIDAMILDIELPSGSGLLLLEKMKNLSMDKPFVVVVTHVASKAVFDALRTLGADYICMKNEVNFSYDTPLSIIEIATPYQVQQESSWKLSEKLNRKTLRKIYEKRVQQEFARFEFPEKLQGTVYCKEAVLYVLMSKNSEVSMTKAVYPYIASRYSTNIQNVERSIRNAIEKVWLEQPLYKLKELYTYDWDENIGRPSNGDFIKNISQKLVRQ